MAVSSDNGSSGSSSSDLSRKEVGDSWNGVQTGEENADDEGRADDDGLRDGHDKSEGIRGISLSLGVKVGWIDRLRSKRAATIDRSSFLPGGERGRAKKG